MLRKIVYLGFLLLSAESFQHARVSLHGTTHIAHAASTRSPAAARVLFRPQPRHEHMLSMSLNNGLNSEQGRPPNKLRILLQRLSVLPLRFWTRYQALSKRAQRLLLIPIMLLAFASAPMASRFQSQNAQRPIEVTYSSFMDLVEQQQKVDTPRVENLRIGSDRLTFRLNRQADSSQRGLAISAKDKKQMDTSSYLSAFTRQGKLICLQT